MVSNDEDAHRAADDAEQKMARKSMEVDAAKVALADGKWMGMN